MTWIRDGGYKSRYFCDITIRKNLGTGKKYFFLCKKKSWKIINLCISDLAFTVLVVTRKTSGSLKRQKHQNRKFSFFLLLQFLITFPTLGIVKRWYCCPFLHTDGPHFSRSFYLRIRLFTNIELVYKATYRVEMSLSIR